ncbi:MAG: response regulator transcription factor [Actinobacteria bacterium]|nr:response regulator transcription factor [Actinomycetota bacterium]
MSLVLIVEDDSTINETLEYNLKREGFSVLVATSGTDGLKLARAGEPDLVLLDLMLPGLDGFKVCQELRENDPALPILMITALQDEGSMVKGFQSGADDYITKPFSIVEVIAKIKAILRRTQALKLRDALQVIETGDLRIDPANYTVSVAGQRTPLRPKEFQLLALLASSPGKLFTREEIAEKVWGYTAVAGRTIDVHVKRVRAKVESHSVHSYIRTVHGLGYRFEVPEDGLADQD